MKISGLKVGGRTLKAVAAVFLCLLTGIVRKFDTAFYAVIAAMLCVQRTSILLIIKTDCPFGNMP